LDIGQIGTIIAAATGISTALAFLLNKIVLKTRHETIQDDKMQVLESDKISCIHGRVILNNKINSRLDNLERRDTDREIMLTQIKEKMESLIQGHEHTQTMISQLTDHQQTTFKALIETINKLGEK